MIGPPMEKTADGSTTVKIEVRAKKNRVAGCLLMLAFAAVAGSRAAELVLDAQGDFDQVKDLPDGTRMPAGWMLNGAFRGNGICRAEPDAERGGYVLAIRAERGDIHAFTSAGFVAGPGAPFDVSFRVRGKGILTLWLYCYGKGGSWVGANVGSPETKVDSEAWQTLTFPLRIPAEPFPKGNIGLIKPALQVKRGGNLQFDDFEIETEVDMTPTESVEAGRRLRLLLPPVIYAVPGIECNIYFDNLLLAVNPANYAFDVDCAKGIQQQERWTFVPKPEDVGDARLTLTVYDDANTALATARSIVRVAPGDRLASYSVLMIGDSLTHASVYPKQVLDNAREDGGLALALVGSNRPGGQDAPVRHEGYGGWTAKLFTSHFSEDPDYQGLRRKSPFLYKNDEGKAELDFARYCAEQNVGKAPDVVTIFLGPNDIFGARDDTIEEAVNTSLRSFDMLIGMVKEFNAATAIGLLLPAPPAATQDAFGANYGCAQTRWQYRRNQHRMVEMMIERYGSREAEEIFLLPTVAAVDPVHGFPMQTAPANSRSAEQIVRLCNGVHPATSGYRQIGDALYCWLKYLAAR